MNLFNSYKPIPVCPHCDTTIREYYIEEDRKMFQIECPNCKKSFNTMRITKVEYQIWK